MPLTPNNREEHWLQGMVDGQTTLEPNKRREYWYKEIVDAIGSGGGGGVLKVGITVDESGYATMDKTWKEINEATFSVAIFPVGVEKVWLFIVSTSANEGLYTVTVTFPNNDSGMVTFTEMDFSTDNENSYPQIVMG